jgi:hypothetical protein
MWKLKFFKRSSFFSNCFIRVIQIKKCDETLPNFILKKTPKKKKNKLKKGHGPKSRQANCPN